MKKRFFANVLSVILLVTAFAFCMIGCSSPSGNSTNADAISLDASAKEIAVGESFTLIATTTPENAQITWTTSSDAVATVDGGTVEGISAGVATITAKNGNATATCTVTVTEENAGDSESGGVTEEKFTVTFKNGDVTIKEIEVTAGETTAYVGIAPTKDATEQYEFTFAGWSLTDGGEIADLGAIAIEKNETFYAVFTESIREYSIKWNIEGEESSENIAYGATPKYVGLTPTKESVGETSYTFIGWASSLTGEVLTEFPQVVGDAVYYAIFAEVTEGMTFNVTWINETEIIETDEGIAYGTEPSFDGATPTKESTETIEYVFAGWSYKDGGEALEQIPTVTANATYFAVFTETARKYEITWMIEGTENVSLIPYGSVPVYDGTPVKADSTTCSYKFDGWALTEGGEVVAELPTVDGEATYYAIFSIGEIFEFPRYLDGKILYSDVSEEVFLPDGLVPENAQISVAYLDGETEVVAYENGEWNYEVFAMTEEELKGNLVGIRWINVEFDNAEKVSVQMLVYRGVIDELSDFPVFFNNEAVANTADNAGDYPMVAPDTYGYYIVTEDLGTGVEELALTQTSETNFQKTNGFNGVLDGQGHTLRFKLTKGGLVGMVLGNAVIKNIAIVYEDATYDSTTRKGGYGVFGYITNGSPEIRNSYIERTNNLFHQGSVFGIMGRPNLKLIMHNTVVYAFNTSNASSWYGNMWINETSTNAFLIHARSNATGWANVTNFTKVFSDAIENGSREVLLSEIEDVKGFDDNYWSKENGKLIWKGFETATVTWVKGEETITEIATKGGFIPYSQTLPEDVVTGDQVTTYYWSLSEDGNPVTFGTYPIQVKENVTYYLVEKVTQFYTVTWIINGETTTTRYQSGEVATHETPVVEDDNYVYEFLGWSESENGEIVELGEVTENVTYYAVFNVTEKAPTPEIPPVEETTTVSEAILYSSNSDELFLPIEITFDIDETVTISSQDGATIYFANGTWLSNFDLTDEQMKKNDIGLFDIMITKDSVGYLAKVKSYAGVIDELSDFPKFFNNTAVASEFDPATYPAVAPNTYGYYIVTKDLGSSTGSGESVVYEDELALTQTEATDYQKTNGFNGVLDGQGHKLQFKLTSGGLVGMVLGNAVIKNVYIKYEDATYDSTTRKGGYGVFGFITNGSPEIRNSYIERTNNLYHQGSVFGLMARPNKKLILHNTVVHGSNTSNQSGWYSNMWINETSTNAFLIYARSNASGWTNATNFTEVTTTNTLTTDLSSFDTNYWRTENSQIAWRGLQGVEYNEAISVNA